MDGRTNKCYRAGENHKPYVGGDLTLSVDSTNVIITGTTEVIGEFDIDWHGRPSFVTLSDETIAMAYVSQSSHPGALFGGAGAGGIHIKFSANYGNTWTAQDTTLAGAAITGFPIAGEPFIMLAPNGNLIIHIARCWNTAEGTLQITSTDGGATWSAEASVSVSDLVGDQDYMALIDDYFAYDGVMYLVGRISTDAAQTGVKPILVKSVDNGASWAFVSDISASGTASEVGIEYLGDDNIIAVLRGSTTTLKTTSADMGATWAATTDLTTTAVIPRSGRHRIFTKNHLEGGANWWEDQKLIMCGFVTDGTRRGNCIWLSDDAGATWSVPLYVDYWYDDAGYGHLFYDPNTGQVGFTSYIGTQGAASLKQYKVRINW